MSSRRQGVRRYLPYLRPYRSGLLLMLLGAVVGIGTGVAIPQLIKQIIDGPVAHHDAAAITGPVVVIIVLALVESGANFIRRNLAGLVSLGVEKDIRDDFYAHLQRLHVGFHDSWQSGQLLSRATSDIGAVRRFIGFGAVFAVIFAIQFGAVMVMLVRLDARLAAVTAVVVIPVAVISRTFFRRYAVIAREVQELTGDVTTVIEEMATGARIIRSFGRADHLFDSYHRQVRLLRGATMDTIRSRSTFWTLMTLFPNVALTLVVLLGGLAVIHHELSVGGLIAYVSYLFMLIWPMDALGWVLAMGDEAHTAALRLSEVFDSDPEVADRPGATDLVDPAARSVSAASASPTARAGSLCCAGSTSTSDPARPWPSSGARGAARPPSRCSCHGCSTPPRARSWSMGATCATSGYGLFVRSSAPPSRTPSSSPPRSARTSTWDATG